MTSGCYECAVRMHRGISREEDGIEYSAIARDTNITAEIPGAGHEQIPACDLVSMVKSCSAVLSFISPLHDIQSISQSEMRRWWKGGRKEVGHEDARIWKKSCKPKMDCGYVDKKCRRPTGVRDRRAFGRGDRGCPMRTPSAPRAVRSPCAPRHL